MGNVITIEAARQQRATTRDNARLIEEYETAGREWAEVVQHAAGVWRDYKAHTGDESATGDQVIGLASMDECRATGSRLRAAREACAAAGLPLDDSDIEIIEVVN